MCEFFVLEQVLDDSEINLIGWLNIVLYRFGNVVTWAIISGSRVWSS